MKRVNTNESSTRLLRSLRASLILSALLALSGCSALSDWGGSKSQTAPKNVDHKSLAKTQAALALRKAESSERQGKIDEAIRSYEQAKALNSKFAHLSRRLAVLYDKRGNDALAKASYEEALQLTPRDANLLNDFGVFHLHRENWQAAEGWFRRSLSIDPKHKRATNNLAMSLAMQNRLRESFEAFSAVVGPAAAHSNIGVLLSKQGRIREAREQFQRALALDRTIPAANHFLAQLDRQSPNNRDQAVIPASHQSRR